MARLRRDTQETVYYTPQTKPLRIVASGTLFLTHTLVIPSHPDPSTVVRAHSVEKARGGSASTVLSLLTQFPAVEAILVAPLGGNDEGQMIIRELESEGVSTRYCKVWKDAGVPSAWILHAADTNTRTVVNHNPLPDITHDEFVSLVGPLLAPENYLESSPVAVSPTNHSHSSPASTPQSFQSGTQSPISTNPNSPAPFDWLHFEGRSAKTTLTNITELDGFAKERKWRSHCVFSVDVGRRGRQGIEALIPHADVLFLNKHYAQANSPNTSTTPRAFLLSLASTVPAHALLVAYWGSEGAAVLSLPTREYFQSSGWVEERSRITTSRPGNYLSTSADVEVRSVRSGSEFWADGRSRSPSSSAFTAGGIRSMSDTNTTGMSPPPKGRSRSRGPRRDRGQWSGRGDEDDDDSQGTEVPGKEEEDDGIVDEVGAHDAFIAGMMYALSRRLVPGAPYTPSWNKDSGIDSAEHEKGRWRLDECLKFATELAGRKARRRDWTGLADEMTLAGWFDN